MVESAKGTRAFYDRLTDALGAVVHDALRTPDRCPFEVSDFVSGRIIEVSYTPPPVGPGGEGRVYVVTDGDAVKVGFTTKTVAERIRDLQTGNPRRIESIVTLHGVGIEVEWKLQEAFGEHHVSGEWYRRDALQSLVAEAGGWEALVVDTLGPGDWHVQRHDSFDSAVGNR